ncbi:DUF6368 family protein [Streptomyces coerulescens]|uniref:DUF6368 family protein n=1 Tax=Streptomyces coerulescens TaxID=29304 RepID=A0ABW0CH21_STRCD
MAARPHGRPRRVTGRHRPPPRQGPGVGLPGTITEVSYDTGGGGRWMRHVGDAEFLAAWLRHPQFRLP